MRGEQHGKSKTPEFFAFNAAKFRCTNPRSNRYSRYGARGIVFSYKSFTEFYKDVGPRPSKEHSLERINNDGNYEPGNCCWATRLEQSLNREGRFHWGHELANEQVGS